ncbi:hypothetical protein H6G95_36825 [Nostoc linckia FACHB-391]|uniref:Lipase domain-containing protein n=3 Tax=Nostoc TaxID=1177 RepID=A0ABR8IJF3_9NOSO|nr:hypothetical protein [Nostoc linckia]MBD2566016.1 hypothetical protein [Nostoc linckia FACHB-391]MBD2651623.1 hypothetical protein [Nostoc foliaceum FACHB-393]
MVEVNFNVWGNGSINRSGRIASEAPTYVVIHGYQNTGGNASNNYKPADWMENIAQTIRQRESNANIILLDWEEGAGSLWYPTSAARTRDVANQLANYLINNGVDPNTVRISRGGKRVYIQPFFSPPASLLPLLHLPASTKKFLNRTVLV